MAIINGATEVITHGLPGTILLSDEITTRLSGLDEGHLEYLAPSRDTFVKGGSAPGFPNLTIKEVTSRSELDEYIVRLYCSGIASGNQRRTSFVWKNNPQGWDEAEETIIAADNASFASGSTLDGADKMFLMEVSEGKHLDGRWSQFQLTYRGIRTLGLVKRTVKVNENIVSPNAPITIGGDLPDPQPTPVDGTISLPRVVVTDLVKSLTPPPTNFIPGIVSSQGMPPVRDVPLSGSGLRRQWPSGWKWADITGEELFRDAKVYLNLYTYEYVWKYTW